VVALAVRHGLEKHRTTVLADKRARPLRRDVDGDNVVAVDAHARDAVGFAA
jgi:hypothetical protein